MSKQVSKTMIGGFVVGAIAILVVAIAAFASLNLFQQKTKYILFFKGSVYGLSVGAPVIFHGVQVGEVIDMYMQLNPKNKEIRIPVLIEMGGAKVQVIGTPVPSEMLSEYRKDPEKFMAALIQRGLRAQLGMQSYVTGQLMVNLDFFPGKPARFVEGSGDYPEIPTVPTTVQMLQQTLRDLPVEKISKTLAASLEGIDRLINSPETSESLRRLNAVLANADSLINHLDEKVDPLASGMASTVSDARATLDDTRKAIAGARSAIENTNNLLAEAKGSPGEISEMQYEFTTAMREFSSAAASFRVFIDYLERHPEMMLKGKQASDEGQ